VEKSNPVEIEELTKELTLIPEDNTRDSPELNVNRSEFVVNRLAYRSFLKIAPPSAISVPEDKPVIFVVFEISKDPPITREA
jgi:hypothetical protein